MPTQPELPPIYWINLDRSAARRERMTARLQLRRHTRIRAVDGKDEAAVRAAIHYSNVTMATAACSASHLRAIQQAFLDGCQEALIVEDDMTFELLSAPRWAELKHSLPVRYGAVRLCTAETPRVLDSLYRRRELLVPIHKVMWCAGAYLIEREAMRCLLERYTRGASFDVSHFIHEQDPEHLVFATLRDASAFCGPFDLRIPLFVYEGLDSDLNSQLLPQYQRARDYMLSHHPALVAGNYRSPFAIGRLLSWMHR
jgi:GR25 family glycosyltransferase involved in LPS biosynthesis